MRSYTFVAAAASCVVATSAASVDVPRQTSGTAGCGISHWFNGITQYHSLTSNGTSRSYSIHLPSNYSQDVPYPVVLGFHGSSSIGLFFEVDTGLSGSQYSANKIMVYPNGLGGAWAGANYSDATVPADLTFVSDLLTEIRANYCVDDSRIYATGMSIGGGFVDTIACSEVGSQFAAFAAGSGSFYTDNNGVGGCTPVKTPVPVLEIHGGADPDVNYNGGEGEGGIEPSIPDWLSWWAQRNNCPDSTKTVEDLFNGTGQHYSWTCNGVEGLLQHWKVDDMGHCWASTSLDFSCLVAGEGPGPISASSIVMAFFDKFTKA
ncbi:carbohydrate esterase family 1 protein [Roridomyces roridus]|uniref:feruloyl esterase n=1 Tax=Roridomyces roridus TaxID=1738132 RepID=A0AAD7CA13_9AGAR|nr:carbohydrate esterase family 1 protein [Roridomyces roridus]